MLSCVVLRERGNEAENVAHLSFCTKKHPYLLLKIISQKKHYVHDRHEKWIRIRF